jgi:hypothetical protein
MFESLSSRERHLQVEIMFTIKLCGEYIGKYLLVLVSPILSFERSIISYIEGRLGSHLAP